ncbi:MAG TPA: AAA family ATPase [Verrucomicrobiae bacterium]|nr:AAA family ATPase [Verrucomicrobiae bacterium]
MQHSWNISGHKKQLELLSKSLVNNKIAHAYVFSGPDDVGKKAVAKNLAKILLCEKQLGCDSCDQCRTLNLSTNPDYIELSQPETIKIDQVRQLVYKLNLKPYLAKHKIAVIDQADSMTTESANAMLKSMEEPKPYTVIILIASNAQRLLPTILSRTQKITFGFVPESEYESLFPESISDTQKGIIQKFASGRPGLVKKLLADPDSLEQLQNIDRQYQTYMKNDLVDRIKLASLLSEAESPEIKSTLQYWLSSLEKDLLNRPQAEVVKKLTLVSKARLMLESNVNCKLLLTQLMLES